jgi:hypothetical protein
MDAELLGAGLLVIVYDSLSATGMPGIIVESQRAFE